MTRRTVAAVLAAIAVLAGLPSVATAVDPSHGTPGFCPTDEGVTVVIDFQGLGGTTIVRCAPGPVGTGHSALLAAGIQLEGTRRWGEAFICRLENRPAANEKVPIQGRPNYQEPCIDTPPASGYWSYWHATNGGEWEYSQWGVKNREAIRGGFEGWSFSLNATASTNPKPRIAPRRPGSAPQPTTSVVPTSGPTGNDPSERQQPVAPPTKAGTTARPEARQPDSTITLGGTGDDSAQPDQRPSSTASTLPPGLPRGRAEGETTGTQGDVPWTGGEPVASGNNSGTPADGVPVMTVLAGFAVLLLLAGAAVTALHRRGRRT